jgi:uncharacterized membrane protein YfcA
MPPKEVVPLAQLLSLVLQVIVVLETRKWLDLRRIWPLLLTGIAAVPLGVYLLLMLDPRLLRVVMGIVVVGSALAMLAGMSWPLRNEKLAGAFVGVLSGALSGSTGIPGPPVILFFANQGLDKQSFRANLVFYFACSSLVAVLSTAVGGLVNGQILVRWASLLPAAVLGTWVGILLARRIDQARFRQVVLSVLVATGGVAIATGLGLL